MFSFTLNATISRIKSYGIGPVSYTHLDVYKRQDLEFVPVVKPYFNSGVPIQVHLLFHPGILYPLGNGWTFGFRLAYENSVNQIGFTPLINKGFKRKNNSVFFLELVAPARFGPEKNSGYTQLGGLHVGLGF